MHNQSLKVNNNTPKKQILVHTWPSLRIHLEVILIVVNCYIEITDNYVTVI